MLNKVMIIGWLGKKPELRHTKTGVAATTLNIATNVNFVDRHGYQVEHTEWHRVEVYQRSAENCASFLAKGSLVYVEGSLHTRKWQDSNGAKHFILAIRGRKIQFLNRKVAHNDELPAVEEQEQGPPFEDELGPIEGDLEEVVF